MNNKKKKIIIGIIANLVFALLVFLSGALTVDNQFTCIEIIACLFLQIFFTFATFVVYYLSEIVSGKNKNKEEEKKDKE